MEENIFNARQGVRKRRSQWIAFGVFKLLSYSIVLILFCILGFIIYKGIGVINWKFLTSPPSDGMTGGGIWPAIVGTFYLMIGSALFAFPVGVMSGIYMNEYAPKGKLVRFIRVMTNNLSGIPSIVFGLFGMALFVKYLGFGDSILAGSLTLGLLCVPLVIRTTEEALKAIPDSYREGSLALGATKLQTIRYVILPMGLILSRGLFLQWEGYREKPHPFCLLVPLTSCRSCRIAYWTNAWPFLIIFMSYRPVEPIWSHNCPLLTELL